MGGLKGTVIQRHGVEKVVNGAYQQNAQLFTPQLITLATGNPELVAPLLSESARAEASAICLNVLKSTISTSFTFHNNIYIHFTQ